MARCSVVWLGLARLALAPLHGETTAPEIRQAVPAALNRLVDDFTARPDFSGVILVGKGDQPLLVRAQGWAAPNVPITAERHFALGSISKWIASLAVLRASDQGALSLDEPILRYLPAYRADNGAQLTLRHLLSHTSGVPNDVVAALRKDRSVAALSLSSDEAVTRFASGDFLFKPGARFDYSHSNWVLVQAILERSQRRDYAALIHEDVLAPLGLEECGIFRGNFEEVPQAAIAFVGVPEKTRMDPAPVFLGGAAGFHATASDLLQLMHGVFHSDFLSSAARRDLLRVIVSEENYALGGRVRELPLGGASQTVAWESGSLGAFKTHVAHSLRADLTVVILSNANTDQAAIATLCEQLLLAATSLPPPPSGTKSHP